MVQHNRLSHALLFLGKEGSGALQLALAFAQYITCEKVNGKQPAAEPSLFGEPDPGSGIRDLSIGQLILSPTRTYAPVLKQLLEDHFEKIHGLIHCSGGGQTKCMKYLPGNFRIIKDNLFKAPEIFNIIQQNSGSNNKEMYEVFNMGCRLEIYCDSADAGIMIDAARSFGIDAQVIGRVEAADKKELLLKINDEDIWYR